MRPNVGADSVGRREADDPFAVEIAGLPTMSAAEREFITLNVMMAFDGQSAIVLRHGLGMQPDEIKSMAGRFATAQLRAEQCERAMQQAGWVIVRGADGKTERVFCGGVRRYIRSSDGGSGSDGGLAVAHVIDGDRSGGAQSTRPCRGRLHNGEQVAVSRFGTARGKLKSRCRECLAADARQPAERAQRLAYMRYYRKTYVPPGNCSRCGGLRTGRGQSAWCLACRNEVRRKVPQRAVRGADGTSVT
jgi:hypothetical protein